MLWNEVGMSIIREVHVPTVGSGNTPDTDNRLVDTPPA
jgi:hypothetical protein